MEAVCARLPMPVTGCTTQGAALRETADDLLLTVAVLTSDEVRFAADISESLLEAPEERIDALYRRTAASLAGNPGLILVSAPSLLTLSADVIVACLSRSSGGRVPVFGACALDVDRSLRNPRTIYQNAAYQDRLAILLLSGAVKPRFFSAPFPRNSIVAQDAIITAAADNRIISINNMPAQVFMKKIGLFHPLASRVLYMIPLVINYRDGSPQVVTMNSADSQGALICSGIVRAGGVLNIGASTADYVIESVKTLVQAVKRAGDGSGLFIVSCYVRSVMLGGGTMAELEAARRELEDFPSPYLFLYSAGEICPRFTESGDPENRLLQVALAACLL
jgi:hypothetical protein